MNGQSRESLRPVDRAFKRVLDIATAIAFIVVLSPILILAALAVLLTSPGPIFYRQQRVGRSGKVFRIFKFRTMLVDSDKCGPSVTSSDDDRITAVGRLFRRAKIDEMPQLLNVLMGHMSMVGPRPQVPLFVDQFETDLRKVVLSVRPGVTGITAICFRNEEEMLANIEDREAYYVQEILPVKLALDAWYVNNRGIGRDLYILAATGWLLVTPPVVSFLKRTKPAGEVLIATKIVDRYFHFSRRYVKHGEVHPLRLLQVPGFHEKREEDGLASVATFVKQPHLTP